MPRQRSRRSRPETCPRRCRPLDPGLAISKANRSTERRAAVTRARDSAPGCVTLICGFLADAASFACSPETFGSRVQAYGQCCVLTTVVWALGLVPVFQEGVSCRLAEREIFAPSARSRHEQGISPNTWKWSLFCEEGHRVHSDRKGAIMSEECRTLRTPVSRLNPLGSPARRKARPPERSGPWLRRRLSGPRG
jgi:hypothetical protein